MGKRLEGGNVGPCLRGPSSSPPPVKSSCGGEAGQTGNESRAPLAGVSDALFLAEALTLGHLGVTVSPVAEEA